MSQRLELWLCLLGFRLNWALLFAACHNWEPCALEGGGATYPWVGASLEPGSQEEQRLPGCTSWKVEEGKKCLTLDVFKEFQNSSVLFVLIWCFSNACLKYLTQESAFTLYLCAALMSLDNSSLPPPATQWKKIATRSHVVFTGLGGSSFMHLNSRKSGLLCW